VFPVPADETEDYYRRCFRKECKDRHIYIKLYTDPRDTSHPSVKATLVLGPGDFAIPRDDTMSEGSYEETKEKALRQLGTFIRQDAAELKRSNMWREISWGTKTSEIGLACWSRFGKG